MTNFSLQSISHNLRLLYLCTWPFCSPPISSGVSSLCGLHWSQCCFSSFYQSLQLSSGILQSSLASIVSCLWGPVVSDVSTTLNRTLTSPCSGIYSFNQSPLVSAVCSGVCSLCKSSLTAVVTMQCSLMSGTTLEWCLQSLQVFTDRCGDQCYLMSGTTLEWSLQFAVVSAVSASLH